MTPSCSTAVLRVLADIAKVGMHWAATQAQQASCRAAGKAPMSLSIGLHPMAAREKACKTQTQGFSQDRGLTLRYMTCMAEGSSFIYSSPDRCTCIQEVQGQDGSSSLCDPFVQKPWRAEPAVARPLPTNNRATAVAKRLGQAGTL